MKPRTQRNCRVLSILLITFWAIRTAEAQDYPHYPPAGSTFVPLDSWVYPALERLAAFGYVTTSLEGMKPWTRTECARLTVEAGDALREAILEDKHPAEEPAQIHSVLEREFAEEIEVIGGGRNRSFRLESVYARALSINGPPLTDGFHFGQTVAYDFGRPFLRGFNAISGGAVRATAGPFAFYVRAEYQHAPGAPALSEAVRSFVSSADRKPLGPASPISSTNRLRLLDAYLSFNLKSWQISLGTQSLNWGVGDEGGMLFSTNAGPLPMARMTRVVPMRLPGFLSLAGPLRVEFFVGQLRGGTIVRHPLLYGQKLSFKVGPHLEVGYGRTVILGGNGGRGADAFTFPNFFRSLIGLRTAIGVPGDNRDAFDVLLFVPGTRNAVSLYGDLYADDKTIYLLDPPRAAYRAGIHISRLPGASRLDFRGEAASTESPVYDGLPGTLNFFNSEYRDGYTSNGQLLGDTVGRQGRWFQGWLTFHLGPTHLFQVGFKHNQVDPKFVPGGGRWQDYRATHEYHFQSGMYVKSSLQIEHIASYPLLFSGRVNNVTATVELGFSFDPGKP
jgi:hypothetical protein